LTLRRIFTLARLDSVLVLALAACRTVPAQSEAPAVITNPTEQSRAALSQAVSQAMNGAPVTLADDALTKSDSLIIEHAHPRDASGLPLNGRERGVAEHFRLVKSGDQCILIHQGTDRRFPLTGVACVLLGRGS
jgi:hypothetical protein